MKVDIVEGIPQWSGDAKFGAMYGPLGRMVYCTMWLNVGKVMWLNVVKVVGDAKFVAMYGPLGRMVYCTYRSNFFNYRVLHLSATFLLFLGKL